MAKTDRLFCAAGHHWERSKSRGQKPKFCPDHQPTEGEDMDMQTLVCAAGHQWQRAAQRGKRPKWCPTHRPTPRPPVRKKEPIDHSLINLTALYERLSGSLSSQVAEDLCALTFATRQIELTSDPNDVKYYQDTQRVWIRQLARDANVDLSDITKD